MYGQLHRRVQYVEHDVGGHPGDDEPPRPVAAAEEEDAPDDRQQSDGADEGVFEGAEGSEVARDFFGGASQFLPLTLLKQEKILGRCQNPRGRFLDRREGRSPLVFFYLSFN